MRKLHDILNQAADRLETPTANRLFELNSELAGARCDLNALVSFGWQNLTGWTRGHFELWENSAWLERRAALAGESYIFRLSASQPIEPKPNRPGEWRAVKTPGAAEAIYAGRQPMVVFLRRLHVTREKAADYNIEPNWAEQVPPGLVKRIRNEILEAIEAPAKSFFSDIEWTVHGLTSSAVPEVVHNSFERQLWTYLSCGYREADHGSPDAVCRLLQPLAAMLKFPARNPAATAALASIDAHPLLTHLLALVELIEDDDLEATFLAYALRQIAALTVPSDRMDDWMLPASFCVRFGEAEAGVYLCCRALDCADANEFPIQLLWDCILNTLNGIGQNGPACPEQVNDLIALLMKYEEEFAEKENYWSLLGLAMRLVPATQELGKRMLQRGLEMARHHLPSRPANQEAASLAVIDPLPWQCLQAALISPECLRHQLACFPMPVLEDLDRPHPSLTVIEGLRPGDYWNGLLPNQAVDYRAMYQAVLEKGVRRRAYDSEVSPLEQADGHPVFAGLNAYSIPTGVPDIIQPLAIVGTPLNANEKREALSLIPLFKAPEGPNTSACVEHLYPYSNAAAGEACIRLPDRQTLFACLPFYFADRSVLWLEESFPLYLNGVGIELQKGIADSPLTLTAPGLKQQNLSASNAVYAIRGRVTSLRAVPIQEADTALCFTLDLGPGLPFPLPVYVHPRLIKGGEVHVGDELSGLVWLCGDFLGAALTVEQWRERHSAPFKPHRHLPRLEPPADHFEFPDSKKPSLAAPPITPETFDAVTHAFSKLASLVGLADCFQWEENPHRIDLSADIRGTRHYYQVEKIIGSAAPSAWHPSDVETLIVRLTPHGNTCEVAYEGFPGPSFPA